MFGPFGSALALLAALNYTSGLTWWQGPPSTAIRLREAQRVDSPQRARTAGWQAEQAYSNVRTAG
jgi:hypothetical protein